MEAALADKWVKFADTSCRGYSPLYDRICRAVAASPDVLDLVEAAPRDAHLPNVLLAAVHYLVLSGEAESLADLYAGRSDADAGPLFTEFCLAHRDRLADIMAARHTNTNEVGRSALLGPLLAEVARRVEQPLGLVDVGCSAGLNLLCDRYRLDYGPGGATGPVGSSVHIDCRVVSGRPPIRPRMPPIADRVGIDRDPVDLHDDTQFLWQLALVWPDTGRLERTRQALEEARRAELRVVAGDAVDDLAGVIRSLPETCHPVVMTTWAAIYLPRARRRELSDRLLSLGADRPVTWISAEGSGVVPLLPKVAPPVDEDGFLGCPLGIVSYRNGRAEPSLAGFAHAHGRWLDWRLDRGD